MKKISKLNKKKATAILASLLWGATVLTGCPASPDEPEEKPVPVVPVDNEDQKYLAEVLTVEEKESIATLTATDIQDAVRSMNKIIEILDSHVKAKDVKAYKTTIDEVASAINGSSLKKIVGENLEIALGEKLTKEEKASYTLGDKKQNSDENGNEYLNYDVYESRYSDASNAINKYDSFYNGDYTNAYNGYSTAYDNYSGAISTYKNQVSGLSQPSYDAVLNIAKNAIEDFKDNYKFDNVYNKEDIVKTVNAAKTEQNAIESSLGSARTNFEALESDYNTSVNNLNAVAPRLAGLKDDVDWSLGNLNTFEFVESTGGNTGSGGNDEPDTPVVNWQNVSVPYTQAEWANYLSTTDWSTVEKVNFTIPEGATEVDIVNLVSRYHDVEAKLAAENDKGSNGKNSRTVEYPKFVPSSVESFNLDMSKISEANLGHYYNEDIRAKDNVVLMESMVDPASVLAGVAVGGKGAKEVIPGVEIVYYKLYENSNYSTGSRMQSINFTDANKKGKVTMPANYNLTGTYKGGIEGNVEFTNLASTTMSGEVRGFESISAIYSTFVKDTDNSKLPTIRNLEYIPIDTDKKVERNKFVGGYNLYGSNLDKIIEKYYSENSSVGKFSMGDALSSYVFDGSEELGDLPMYRENGEYGATPYALDINAALLMKAQLKNIRVTGVNKIGKTSYGINMANVRFSADMSGITFSSFSGGVIEFENDAPSVIDVGSSSKVILHKVSHETKVSSANIELKDTVTQAQADNLKDYVAGNVSSVYRNDKSIQLNNLSATDSEKAAPSENARWERAGNQGKSYSEVSQLMLKKSSKSKKSLIDLILDDKQKQYS